MAPPLLHDDVFRRLCRARELVHERFREPITLDELARSAGFSRYHFLRLFRDAFGATPREYLTEVRLARARELLARDEAPVTDVCFDVGFSSLGSFSTLFAQRVGCPPTAFRRRIWHFRSTLGEPALVIPYCFYSWFGLG